MDGGQAEEFSGGRQVENMVERGGDRTVNETLFSNN
jgi:hypothetical protein